MALQNKPAPPWSIALHQVQVTLYINIKMPIDILGSFRRKKKWKYYPVKCQLMSISIYIKSNFIHLHLTLMIFYPSEKFVDLPSPSIKISSKDFVFWYSIKTWLQYLTSVGLVIKQTSVTSALPLQLPTIHTS